MSFDEKQGKKKKPRTTLPNVTRSINNKAQIEEGNA